MKTGIFKTISKKQCTDTGMIMVLIAVGLGLFLENSVFQIIAVILVIIDLLVPWCYYPLAVVWFGMSHLLGILTSGILLSIIFFVVVAPVGIIRRISGKDRLTLKQFKKDKGTAFISRLHKYVPDDLAHPY
ncbi:MAG TPA: SxtJ family membrane protein [Bacteroidales bacterium]|nr:SxtJ family membrane protein [Bacteroidales bacterium]